MSTLVRAADLPIAHIDVDRASAEADLPLLKAEVHRLEAECAEAPGIDAKH